jgi:hypothetical protein
MSTRQRAAASVAVVLLLAAAISATVHSAFTDAVANEGSTFRAGTIDLRDDGVAGALFDLDGLRPGVKRSRCFTVRYSSTGDVPSTLHLRATADGELAQHLWVAIWPGTIPASATPEQRRACEGFVPNAIMSMHTGKLADFPQTAATALRDPRDEVRDGEEVVYRVMTWVDDTDDAQGLSARARFVVEARSK